MLFEDTTGTCPFCFETIYIPIDPGSGENQETIVDCEVCCQPIQVKAKLDHETGEYLLTLERSQ